MRLTIEGIRKKSRLELQLMGDPDAEYFLAVYNVNPGPSSELRVIQTVMTRTGLTSEDIPNGMARTNYMFAVCVDGLIRERFPGMSPEDVAAFVKLHGDE